jgi:hypothetical protein
MNEQDDTLPPKPPIEGMPPEEGEEPPSEEEEQEALEGHEDDVLSSEDADADDTVDNTEGAEGDRAT